jgi:hypothetical protein
VVLVQSVSKLYRLYQNPSDRIRELIPFQSRALHHDFHPAADNRASGVTQARGGAVVHFDGSDAKCRQREVEGQNKPARERALP